MSHRPIGGNHPVPASGRGKTPRTSDAVKQLSVAEGFNVDKERLLDRFLRYVRVETTADEDVGDYPSTPGQIDLGRAIADELRAIGAADVEHDEFGLVWATVPATNGKSGPVVAFNAHLDTSPETSGANVQPQVIREFPGGDIRLPAADLAISVADNPELHDLVGATLITTDGTTLLGGDDKAGVAVIVEMARHLLENPDILHGPVRILFTCDEEIGRGVNHVDLDKLAATACYTLDGGGAGDLDVETFSADVAHVRIQGVNIHPSIAKDRMVNAIRVAGVFLSRLPLDQLAPEKTCGRDGFVHPYVMEGGVAEVDIRVLLRDFDTAALRDQELLLRNLAADVASGFPGCRIEIDVTRQYRNMADWLSKEPRAVALAVDAHANLNRHVNQTIVRGGTDGSQLTEMGLPTPNLSTGQHNPHSPLEWACLDEMQSAVEVIVELVRVWGEQPDPSIE
ncbi:MAG: peptidase T [Pirellulaceae bacterium]|jgi:tripeptide aminopeptidase|nr:peptidase T [Pirellulaceae bacterium]MDP7018842.1 peptidase T [Pirellulaceae bacterium]